MIWVGQFDSEADFEKYMDQSAFRQWWKEYDEDNKELRCQFCKELGVMDYDEDSLIMKYSSEGLENLLNVIPADTDKIKEILRAKKITVANAAIMYNSHEGISLQKATNTVSVSFLGSFIFELNPTGTTASTAGLKYMTWIGHTDKNETEFMEYFNQEQYLKELEAYESGQSKKRPNPEHRCQFCKDLGIKFYYPEFLRIKIDKTCTMNSVQLIQSVIIDNNVLDCWVEKSLNRNGLNNASNNCTFCYIPNGFRDKNKSSMELKQYLKTNCHWENRVIISPNELVAIYSKANYQPTSKLIDFLIYFYNQEFQFPKVDVHFNLKKTLNDNPHYLFYDQFCELLHVSDICPFGEYEHGYMVLLVDSKNNIYGVMDDYVEGFGNDYFKMLNQLYNR